MLIKGEEGKTIKRAKIPQRRRMININHNSKIIIFYCSNGYTFIDSYTALIYRKVYLEPLY